ncbi:hypothetical protein [Deinococcus maricopensis]|uniref:Cell wall associated fibronectin-binding protein n=1 Tax=Deinococcus maricopensis (strain DSM 21211 / LMG 22137 / NRRL B-23946 / LB-34) TaxID=709986 RepID=E8U778_DEIML|nr:hypothetical protein [Deinococcus maricopensis]ADV66917.1 cell wall associated fibronectin-binding protein [Deinococcus maricopensis DSM 21211]
MPKTQLKHLLEFLHANQPEDGQELSFTLPNGGTLIMARSGALRRSVDGSAPEQQVTHITLTLVEAVSGSRGEHIEPDPT